MTTVVAASVVLAGCGGGARQDANEPKGTYNVEVRAASFPVRQSLAQASHLVIVVKNADTKTIPNVAVTITDSNLGTKAQAFSELLNMPGLASASRPVWIVDRGPSPNGCGYSCRQGGPGGGVTAYSNTWALGQLKPGASAVFNWRVTAVKSGLHVVHYQIAAGLNGNAVAQLAGGQKPQGTFVVHITQAPQQSFVNDKGQVVTVSR
ncbi:MAG TPA: hypothetical protein VNR66_11740 [Solirubrobacteraceae bacterium]|nr:hypothetical protein [Solirubrobacteraceae bacterium]